MKLLYLEQEYVLVLGIDHEKDIGSGRNDVHWNQLPEPAVSWEVSVAMQRVVQIWRQNDVASVGVSQFLNQSTSNTNNFPKMTLTDSCKILGDHYIGVEYTKHSTEEKLYLFTISFVSY